MLHLLTLVGYEHEPRVYRFRAAFHEDTTGGTLTVDYQARDLLSPTRFRRVALEQTDRLPGNYTPRELQHLIREALRRGEQSSPLVPLLESDSRSIRFSAETAIYYLESLQPEEADTMFLQEASTTTSRRVDRSTGLVRDVKLLGKQSRNGRAYSLTAIQNAAKLAEGAAVYLDHQPKGNRSVRDRIGTVERTFLRDGELRGDLRLNPRHAMFEQLAHDIESDAKNIGMSIDAEGAVTRNPKGPDIVENIQQIRSVDIVANPATTMSFTESVDRPAYPEGGLRAALGLDTESKPRRNELVEAVRGYKPPNSDYPEGGIWAALGIEPPTHVKEAQVQESQQSTGYPAGGLKEALGLR